MTEDRGVTVEDLEGVDSIISGPDEAPKSRPKRGKRERASGRSSSPLARRVEKLISVIGSAVQPLDYYDGQVLKDNAGEIAQALADLAQESPRVRAFLEGSVEAGAWSSVFLIVGGKVAVPIAARHGWLGSMSEPVAESVGIPVKARKPKYRAASPLDYERPERDDDGDEGELWGLVRDPETGQMVRTKLGPDRRPITDEDGRPIVDDETTPVGS